MGVMERRRLMLAEAAQSLPPVYRQVNYILASGDKAVIDTGVPGNNDNLSFHFKFNVDTFIAYRGFFTNYASETANCWRLSEGGSSGFIFNVNSRTGSSTPYSYGSFLNKDTEVTLNKSNLVVYTNGTTYTRAAEITAGTENSTTIYINSSRRYARTNTDVIKWYYFQIFDSGNLIRDYIPCCRKSDGKAGFYDLVNHTFKPSTGTADFTIPA